MEFEYENEKEENKSEAWFFTHIMLLESIIIGLSDP